MGGEEIAEIREKINDFSFEELESRLAIIFANAKMAGATEFKKIPVPEQKISEFATFMSKYQKK